MIFQIVLREPRSLLQLETCRNASLKLYELYSASGWTHIPTDSCHAHTCSGDTRMSLPLSRTNRLAVSLGIDLRISANRQPTLSQWPKSRLRFDKRLFQIQVKPTESIQFVPRRSDSFHTVIVAVKIVSFSSSFSQQNRFEKEKEELTLLPV